MSLPVVTPPTSSSALAPPVRTRTSGAFRGGSPLVWFVALLVVATTLGPVLYAVLGAFQFSARLRRRHPRWHRSAGKVVVALGLMVAASGLWMTLSYARQPGTGELAFLLRLAFGSALAACIVLGLSAIRRGDSPAMPSEPKPPAALTAAQTSA